MARGALPDWSPPLRLARPPDELPRRGSVIVHALETLPVVLRPAAAGSASA